MTLTIGGQTFTANKLADITITKSRSGMGFSGVVTSSISGRVKTSTAFDQGAAVVVGYDYWNFPTFYIDSSSYDGTSVQFTAYDKCKNLDIPFDRTGYSYKTGDTINQYQTSLVVGNLCGQCGFASSSYSSAKSTLNYNEMDGSCRQILEKLSQADCGVFYCTANDTLGFISATGTSGSVVVWDNSPVIEQSKRDISGLVITDTHSNEVYKFGSSSYQYVGIIEGDFINQSIAQGIAATLINSGQGAFHYYAFNIQSAEIDDNVEIGGQIQLGTGQDAQILPYKIGNITMRFGAIKVVANLSSPVVYEGYTAYINAINRKAKDKVNKDTTYNTYFVNNTGDGRRVKI